MKVPKNLKIELSYDPAIPLFGIYIKKENNNLKRYIHPFSRSFPSGSDGKASACTVGDPGLIPGLGTSLEEEMATHSSTFAWRIPWMEEPGGPQSMGSQRVGHD